MRTRTKSIRELERNHEIEKVINHLLLLAVKNSRLEEILKQCLDIILAFPWLSFAKTGSIFVTENNSHRFEMKATKGLGRKLSLQCRHIQTGQCLCGLAAQEKKIVFTSQINKQHALSGDSSSEHGHYCVPIIFSKKVLGILNIHVKAGHRQTKAEERFLVAIANTLAGIIQRKKIEKALDRTHKALRTLSACNHTLIHAIDEKKLLEEVCRIIVEIGEYKIAWIGRAEKGNSKSIRLLAYAKEGRSYLTKTKPTWNVRDEKDRGPTSTAVRTGKVSISKYFENSPRPELWKKEAARLGFYNSIAIPLKFAHSVFGVITIYSADADAFDKREVELLKELANDLAFGLETLRLKKAHEKTREEKNQTEKQLLESYKHLGTINRQISILLDLYARSGGKNTQEILEYIAKSAYNLSQADSIKFFRYSKSDESFVSLPIGNDREFKNNTFRIPIKKHPFLKPLIEKKIRVQNSFVKDLHGEFIPSKNAIKYFLFLPILSGKQLRGSVLFCFSDRESITPQELDFFEAFAAQASLVLKNLEIFKKKRIKNKENKSATQLELFQLAKGK